MVDDMGSQRHTITTSRAPARDDDRAVGWHRTPDRAGTVQWWNGHEWVGPVRPYPHLSLRPLRVARFLVAVLGGAAILYAEMYASAGVAADLLFVGWVVAWNVAAAEFVRATGVSTVRSHTPAMIGEDAWIADPAGRHELRYWDGHRFTEHVADPERAPGVIATDEQAGPQWDPPAPAWERLGRASVWAGVIAALNLLNPIGFFFLTVPCALFALRWGVSCVGNARRCGGSVPVSAIVGIVLAVVTLLLLLPTYSMWTAIGNADW
jgi:hypothetical protein